MGVAAAAAGAVLQVAGTLMEARGQQKDLKRAAKADEANARSATMEGELEAEQMRRDARALAGEAIVMQAENGAGVGTGSAADLLEQSAIDTEYAIMSRRYQADSEAQNLYKSAKQKRKAARGVMIAGIMRAGAQALSGASSMSAGSSVSAASANYRAASVGNGSLQLPAPRGY